MLYYYYPRTINSVITAFGAKFNNFHVYKYDTSGNAVEKVDVPLIFGPRSKIYDDRKENYYTDKDGVVHGDPYWLKIPRIEFDLNGIVYDGERATGTNTWRYFHYNNEISELADRSLYKVISDYQPAPYNIQFNVKVVSDSFDMTWQILENILPYYNPTGNLRVKEFSFLNIERDLDIHLDGVSPDFSSDMSEQDRRQTNFSMNFTIKCWMYRPFVHTDVIKYINTKYHTIGKGGYEYSTDTITTSGVQTSGGGIIIDTSGVPPTSAYTLSATYDGADKEFVWFEQRS